MSAAMAISSPPPTVCPFSAAMTSFGVCFETVERLVRMEAEVVLELRRDLRKHLDVRAGGEELVARAAEHDDVDVVVHTRIEDARIELLVHLVGVGVGGGIVQLEDRHPFFHPIVDQTSSHDVSCSVNAARIVRQAISGVAGRGSGLGIRGRREASSPTPSFRLPTPDSRLPTAPDSRLPNSRPPDSRLPTPELPTPDPRTSDSRRPTPLRPFRHVHPVLSAGTAVAQA